ncbi:MAG: ABC transporter ATP-binding protein [Elusimicrobia bacterium]|nr:ABC transporter ATP-binding protein [Elusimicrobiota bacterium]
MIRASGLSKTYDSGVQPVRALQDVSLEVEAGEFLAIAGPSGSGKSTFLNIVGGLDRPSSGSLLLDGVELGALDAAALCRLRREKLGFVFQSYNLIPVLTARENVEFGLILRGINSGEESRRARDVLEKVGLAAMSERRPAELSGGQQQRVAVARAIAGGPRLVIADEPTANLDSSTAQELMALFEQLNRDQGITFLFSSHDPEVLRRARRVVHFKDGQVV